MNIEKLNGTLTLYRSVLVSRQSAIMGPGLGAQFSKMFDVSNIYCLLSQKRIYGKG